MVPRFYSSSANAEPQAGAGWTILVNPANGEYQRMRKYHTGPNTALPEETNNNYNVDKYVNNSVDNSIENSTTVYNYHVLPEKAPSGADLRWLDAQSYYARYAFLQGQRKCAETGAWFINHPDFKSWVEGKEGSQNFLYCEGIPGSGKSVLASLAVNHLQHKFVENGKVAIVYIFCNFKEQDQQSAIDLVKSILAQLSILSRIAKVEANDEVRLCRVLDGLREKHENRDTSPTLEEYMSAIKELAAEFDHCFLIADAIDELSDRARDDFVSASGELVKLGETRMLITTRPIQRIWSMIRDEVAEPCRIDIAASGDDIEAFVRRELKVRRCFRDILEDAAAVEPGLADMMVRGVRERAKGMFLLPRFHVDALSEAMSISDVHAIMESLPVQINEMYDDVLQRIEARGRQNRHSVGLIAMAKRALLWVAYSIGPIYMSALQAAVAIEDPASLTVDVMAPERLPFPRALLFACAGLIVHDSEKGEDGVVRLVHYTAQDYFKNQGAHHVRPDNGMSPDCWIGLACVSRLCFGKVMGEGMFGLYAYLTWSSHLLRSPPPLAAALAERLVQAMSLLAAERGHTAGLDMAVEYNLVELVRHMWAVGTPADGGKWALRIALTHTPDAGMVEALLDLGADLDERHVQSFGIWDGDAESTLQVLRMLWRSRHGDTFRKLGVYMAESATNRPVVLRALGSAEFGLDLNEVLVDRQQLNTPDWLDHDSLMSGVGLMRDNVTGTLVERALLRRSHNATQTLLQLGARALRPGGYEYSYTTSAINVATCAASEWPHPDTHIGFRPQGLRDRLYAKVVPSEVVRALVEDALAHWDGRDARICPHLHFVPAYAARNGEMDMLRRVLAVFRRVRSDGECRFRVRWALREAIYAGQEAAVEMLLGEEDAWAAAAGTVCLSAELAFAVGYGRRDMVAKLLAARGRYHLDLDNTLAVARAWYHSSHAIVSLLLAAGAHADQHIHYPEALRGYGDAIRDTYVECPHNQGTRCSDKWWCGRHSDSFEYITFTHQNYRVPWQVTNYRHALARRQDFSRTPLHRAAEGGNLELVRSMIDQGTAVDVNSRWSTTPLHFACMYGHRPVVSFLLSHGASPNYSSVVWPIAESYKWRHPLPWPVLAPLHYAIYAVFSGCSDEYRCNDIIRELFRHGADIHALESFQFPRDPEIYGDLDPRTEFEFDQHYSDLGRTCPWYCHRGTLRKLKAFPSIMSTIRENLKLLSPDVRNLSSFVEGIWDEDGPPEGEPGVDFS
ncbi:hypothetical protein DFH27DRAFT_600132 [Peziza echinospora]|nr:hypothetical protein DFH27DRAFT_600132 [Peziza echinospora]